MGYMKVSGAGRMNVGVWRKQAVCRRAAGSPKMLSIGQGEWAAVLWIRWNAGGGERRTLPKIKQ